MPPRGEKRKRPERTESRDETSGRPSPHRPQDLGLAQQGQQHGGSRGGKGGGSRRPSRQMAQSPVNGNNAAPVTTQNDTSPTTMPAPAHLSSIQRDSPAVDGSRPATPSQTATAPSQPPASVATKAPPAPYWYDYITDAMLESWQESGRESVLDAAKEADLVIVSTIFQELVRSALDGRLDAIDAGSLVQQVITHHSEGDLDTQALFLNGLSLLEETQSDLQNPNLLALVAATDIDPAVIRHELDIYLLMALPLVRSTFKRMRIRKQTVILYRQANFNLLREESEGYAKLITEYFNTANEATHDHSVSAEKAFERITALVGSFDLDVGRVLDISLDISANLLVRAYDFFIKFYRCSSWWPENTVPDNVKYEDQGFNSFPNWALPGYDDESMTAEEKAFQKEEDAAALASMKSARDIRFWQRVQEVGTEAFFELGSRKILNLDDIRPLLETEIPQRFDHQNVEVTPDKRNRINADRKYMLDTGTLPPAGNPDAAQLLGFKLRFYASSARDAQDTLPENLIYLAALLIKIGFISLRDLYPHLYPADDKMADERTRLEKEKAEKEAKERPGVGSNALAMSGALTDDTLPVVATRALREKEKSGGSTPKPDKKDEESKDELPPPSNQKILLLKALLLIGALPESLYILGRFPWLVDVDHTLPPYLHRIANQMLSKVAEIVRPLNRSDDTQIMRDELETIVPRSDGSLTFRQREQKKSTRWLGLDQVEKGDGLTYKHYYPDWEDNIPLCQDVEDVFSLCNTFLGYLGVKIGQDAKLLGTLIRIAKSSLMEDFSEANQTRWLDLMRRLLVPALSLSKHNAGLTQEVYELLKLFPTTTRYNIYAEWYRGKTSRLPDMRVAFDHNRAEVKDVLRRVTNETGKKQARALAKVSFSSPGVVMMSMISQLESYSNMIPSLVECTRYFPSLAYDVLTWCLINSLSGQGRDRMQADGMLTSPWLQALSSFVASLFYRYTALNPSPILQYLASELRAGNSTDLEMFEQLLAEMAGIRPDMEFNDAQVLAMAGGKHLQAQTVLQLADKRHDRKSQAQRLIKALSDPGLIGQTLISIAQERQNYPYHDASKLMPLKVLGNNLDKVQLVFAQYLDVLKTNLSPNDFETAVPDVVTLIADFGLDPGIAFTICRFCIAQRLFDYDSSEKLRTEERKRTASQSQERAQVNRDVEMQEGKPVVHGDRNTPEPTQESTDASAKVIVDEESKAALTPQPTVSNEEPLPWHPVLQDIIHGLTEVSPNLAEQVSIPFFVSFWTRSLQDILVHTPSYDNEINKLRNQLKDVNTDRTDVSASGLKERERKKKALTDTQDKLRDELKGRIASYQKTRNRISRQEKDHWFSRSMKKKESDARHIGLLQECFLPRAMLSSLDAHYCFLMLKILHDNGTPGFKTVQLLEMLFRGNELATLMFQCTAMEAQHFGRFLCETLRLLQHWHSDKAIYEREALGEKQKLPGFAKKLDANGDPQVVLDYEQYRQMLYNWHQHLKDALIACFESSEYMYIRNGIIVLRAIVHVFPSVNFMGQNMVKHITKLSDEEARQDLKLAARSLLGPLKTREKQWVLPQLFRLNDTSTQPGRSGSRAPSARPETPQPSTGTPKLNAAATEFKPSSGLVNGVARKESIAGVEDGEIEDEKQATTKDREADADSDVKTATETTAAPAAGKQEDQSIQEAAPEIVAADSGRTAERSASKPSTPAPVPSKPPPPRYQPDASRPSSTQPAASRSAHALPSRPPNKPLPAPPGPDRTSSRYGSRADEQYGRLNRPSEVRPASRDQSPGRSRPRTPERDPYYGHSSSSRGPPRDERVPARSGADSRSARDEAWTGSRRDQTPQSVHSRAPAYDSRDHGNGTMAPPPNTAPNQTPENARSNAASTAPSQISRQPPSTGSANQSAQKDNQYHENPARLAMIAKETTDGRDRSRDSSAQRDSRRDRDARDERGQPSARPIDGRSGPQDSARESHSRGDQPSELTPRGPRRHGGRLSQDLGSAPQQESSYGRLNGTQDVPVAPRVPNGPSGRVSRTYPAPTSQSNPRPNDQPPAASPSTTRPPESPAALRGPQPRQPIDRRGSGPQFDRQSSSNSVPMTPATEDAPQVHPSRLAQVESQPLPIQTNLPPQNSRVAGSPTTAPPSGPRGANRPPAGTPTGPSPTSNAPAGPASATERQRRPERRQLGSINAMLQGASGGSAPNGQGVSFRGAAQQGRQPSNNVNSGANSQPVQAIASSFDPPSRRTEREEAPRSRPEMQGDLFQAKQSSHEDNGRANSRSNQRGEERTDRQRGSRNASRERRGADEPPQPPFNTDESAARRGGRDDRRPRDERDNRGTTAPRDGRGPRNDDLPPQRPPPSGAPNSFSRPPPDWERGDSRRGQPPREAPERSTRGGSRPEEFRAPRGQDDRRGPPPPPPPAGRKRPREDAPFDQSKRTRSGR